MKFTNFYFCGFKMESKLIFGIKIKYNEVLTYFYIPKKKKYWTYTAESLLLHTKWQPVDSVHITNRDESLGL